MSRDRGPGGSRLGRHGLLHRARRPERHRDHVRSLCRDDTPPASAGISRCRFRTMQIVDVSSVRTTEIGFAGRSDRLREALMLTDDENIVDVQFTVSTASSRATARARLRLRIRQPGLTVTQAAESAMREVVGRKGNGQRPLRKQGRDRRGRQRSRWGHARSLLLSGIEVVSVAIQNAQPPQQVQAAFNDAVKAGRDRERRSTSARPTATPSSRRPKVPPHASRKRRSAIRPASSRPPEAMPTASPPCSPSTPGLLKSRATDSTSTPCATS